MDMPFATVNGVRTHYQLDGFESGSPLVLAGSLGTDLRMWEPLMPYLPPECRILRYDMRGHGQSDVPTPPYSMGALIRDVECLMEQLEMRDAVFVGLSTGGLIAQGLAAKRYDLVRALVLSGTAVKIGTPQMWQDRIDAVTKAGIGAIAGPILQRWFSRDSLASGDLGYWQDMLTGQADAGYAGVCAAIAGTDFLSPTSVLRLPTLGIAGSEDGATPPDLVRETISLIPGARFELMRRAGHLPFLEQPAAFGRLLCGFLNDIGHV